MRLDILTLTAVGSFVATLAALLLAGAWVLMRDRSLAWWAAASTIQAGGIALLVYGLATVDRNDIALGAALASIAPILVWAGARDFSDRGIWLPVLLAAIIATALSIALLFPDAQRWTRLAGLGSWVVFLLAATFELWRGWREPLRARWALMALFVLHAAVFVGGIIDNHVGSPNAIGVPLTLDSWFGLIHFESLIYSMGTAVFMVVMCKERSELLYSRAARIDSLTGVVSRGAFMAQASQMLIRCRKSLQPLTVIVFDLDRFKAINDTHGHRTGDRVLQVFADSARRMLRPNDMLGRHGGEEFALVLPGATIDAGYVIAERIRVGFAEACRELDEPIAATLSAGVATATSESTFDALVEAADNALYRAKNLGRNRVERADAEGSKNPPPKVTRVA
jgi:diguanylate cyclase (GGDEF)-like protein